MEKTLGDTNAAPQQEANTFSQALREAVPSSAQPDDGPGGQKRRREHDRLRTQQAPTHDAPQTSPVQGEPGPRPMPAHIAAKFLRDGDTYYFADQTVAFVDSGTKLRAATENPAVIRDLVRIAQARGWPAGIVRGTENFRREVWKQAYAQGLEVSGYAPTSLERQAAQRERERRAASSQQAAPSPAAPAAPRSAAAGIAAPARPPSTAEAVVYGRLLEHGEAPYKFDRRNDASYFVKLEGLDGGARAYWGAGLQEALRESQTQVQVGDHVGIRQVGQRTVRVPAMKIDEQSGEILETPTTAQRKEWAVEKAAYFDDPQRLARDVQARLERARDDGVSFESFVDAPHAARPERPSGERQGDVNRKAQRNALEARDELQRRSPRAAAAVFSTARAGEKLAEAFVQAKLVRPSDREEVIRIFEAAAQRRGRHEFSADEFERTLRNAVFQAADEVGRTPMSTARDQAVPQAPAPRAPVREDVQVRG